MILVESCLFPSFWLWNYRNVQAVVTFLWQEIDWNKYLYQVKTPLSCWRLTLVNCILIWINNKNILIKLLGKIVFSVQLHIRIKTIKPFYQDYFWSSKSCFVRCVLTKYMKCNLTTFSFFFFLHIRVYNLIYYELIIQKILFVLLMFDCRV